MLLLDHWLLLGSWWPLCGLGPLYYWILSSFRFWLLIASSLCVCMLPRFQLVSLFWVDLSFCFTTHIHSCFIFLYYAHSFLFYCSVVCRGVELFLVWDVSVGYYTYTCLLFIFMVVAVHVVVHSVWCCLWLGKIVTIFCFAGESVRVISWWFWLILFVWMWRVVGWGIPACQAGSTRVRWWNRGCSWSRRLEEEVEEEESRMRVRSGRRRRPTVAWGISSAWQAYTLPEIGAVCKCWRAVSSGGSIGGFGGWLVCDWLSWYQQRYWWGICLDLVSMDCLTSSYVPFAVLLELVSVCFFDLWSCCMYLILLLFMPLTFGGESG